MGGRSSQRIGIVPGARARARARDCCREARPARVDTAIETRQMTSSKPAEHHSLLVTDFDGTMTRHDFYMLAARSLLPPVMPDYSAQYRAGQLTHFEALRAIFASIRADPATVRAVVDRMELDPDLPRAALSARAVGLGRGRDLGRLRLVHSHPAG